MSELTANNIILMYFRVLNGIYVFPPEVIPSDS